MGYRRSQFNTSHPLTADTGLGDLDAASVTDDAFISDLFVFAAMALPVFGGAEDLLAEQTVLFRLERSVVDRFRFCDLTQARLFDLFGGLGRVTAVGPLSDLIRGRESDFYRSCFVFGIFTSFPCACRACQICYGSKGNNLKPSAVAIRFPRTAI